MGFTGNEKKLGFGLMRLPLNDPNKAGDIDIEQVKRMVDLFMERGFTYFDTAWMYCGLGCLLSSKRPFKNLGLVLGASSLGSGNL